VIIAGSVSDEEAKKIYLQDWKAPKAISLAFAWLRLRTDLPWD
jgi:hypothetical protein